MLDQIINMAKEQLSPKLKQEAQLDDNQIDETMEVAEETVSENLKTQVLDGNASMIMGLFNGQESTTDENPLIRTLVSSFTVKLTSRLGIDAGKAQQIAGMVIPFIADKFSSDETGTASDETDLMSKLNFDKDTAISSFMKGKLGGSAGGLLGGLGKVFD